MGNTAEGRFKVHLEGIMVKAHFLIVGELLRNCGYSTVFPQ